jgi:acetyl-CoA carboxylase carboxyl transferase subunit alpha
MKLTARDLAEAGVVDAIIPEPEGGAHEDYAQSGGAVRDALLGALAEMDAEFGRADDLDTAALLEARFEKYRRVGVVRDSALPPQWDRDGEGTRD